MPLLSNVPALRLFASYLIHDPSSLLPHQTISTFISLPLPLGPTLPGRPKIRALVLDKDNTLCPPDTVKNHQAYMNKVEKIRESEEFSHNKHSVIIVSNTTGTGQGSQQDEDDIHTLEQELGIPVLRQDTGKDGKKPLNGKAILQYFKEKGVTEKASEIAIVGDRLATDVLLAREMGSWSVWVKDGWRNPEMPGRNWNGSINKWEARLEGLVRAGFQKKAPLPEVFDG